MSEASNTPGIRFTVIGVPEIEDEPLTLFGECTPSQSDRDRMLAIFAFLCPESDYLHRFFVPGIPYSKRRARLGKGGRFYSEDKQHEKALGLRFRHFIGDALLDGNVALGCIFFRPNRRRIDVDNLMKLVMDAATGTLWRDDCQVTAQLGIIEVDRENPRTLIVLGRHRSTMDRTYDGGKSYLRRGEMSSGDLIDRSESADILSVGHRVSDSGSAKP